MNLEGHKIGGTSIKDGAMCGSAVVGQENAKITAVGKYIICRIEMANEFSKGGIVLPGGSREKVVVDSIGSDVTLKHVDGSPLKEGDCILVAQLTKMQVFNPLSGKDEEIGIYAQEHVMGIIE